MSVFAPYIQYNYHKWLCNLTYVGLWGERFRLNNKGSKHQQQQCQPNVQAVAVVVLALTGSLHVPYFPAASQLVSEASTAVPSYQLQTNPSTASNLWSGVLFYRGSLHLFFVFSRKKTEIKTAFGRIRTPGLQLEKADDDFYSNRNPGFS